jgi:AraC-like DNA-binding protein
LLWFDFTSELQDPELRVVCARFFRVAYSTRCNRVAADIENLMPSVLCFDFDHPDRHRLQTLQDMKKAYPRLPILMLTLDHSEALAVWAFRARVWNYLVKPVAVADFSDSLEALAQITRRAAPPRVALSPEARVPRDLLAEPIDLRVARLQPALHYVKRCFGEKLAEAEAAQRCGMSRFALSRSFHATFGMTFREYVMRVRIAEARRLLAEGGHSMTEVAYATGFTDGSYFAHMFKRHTGILPSEYQGSALGQRPAESPPEPLPHSLTATHAQELS